MRDPFRWLAWALACASCASPAFADCKLERFAELPVTMASTRPLVAGSVNGNEALFIADSGAFFSTLTRDAAEKFKLRWEPLPPGINVYGVKGGDVDVRLGVSKDFTLVGLGNGAALHGVEFLVGGNSFAGGAAGVIGQNVIGRADTEYDLANGVIRLIRSRDCGNGVLAYWAKDQAIGIVKIHDTTPAVPQLLGEALLNGAKIGIMFDTGASYSMLSFRGARRAGVKLDGPEVQAGGTSQGLSAEDFQTWISRFDTLDLGGETIKNARLRIADIDLPGGADLLLGADFFLSHRIYVASSQHRIFFTYNGGHVFDLRSTSAAAPDTAPAEPTDASGYQRRGAAYVGRREIAKGIADFDRALQLDPTDPAIYSQRGLAHWQNGDAAQALSDFDQALQLKPDDVPVLVQRGSLRMQRNDPSGARSDFDRAESLAPNDATVSLEIAQVFAHNGHYSEALARYGVWIAAHPRDDRIGAALADRCWIRAVMGDAPDQALSDCNGAIRDGRRTARAYEGRALAWLRLKNFDHASADFRDSLKLEPKNAHTLYGLGIAEIKRGQQAAGENDLQAALALDVATADYYKRIGLAP
jgi:tetratricopeptide (TPR) repeat protein